MQTYLQHTSERTIGYWGDSTSSVPTFTQIHVP